MADWMEGTRQKQLDMAQKWLSVFNEPADPDNPGGISNAQAWGIPDETVQKLEPLESEAFKALEAAKSERTRTPVANQACETAFTNLCACMREIKRRSLFSPPITRAQMVALGFKFSDRKTGSSGDPTAQLMVRPFPSGGFHEIGIYLEFIKGGIDELANGEYRVYYKVVAPGEKIPTSPEELTESFSTKRRKDVLPLNYEDSGKTIYFAVRVEKKRRKGPWGPITHAVIP